MMAWSLLDLPPHMRQQAQAKLAAAGRVRVNVLKDDEEPRGGLTQADRVAGGLARKGRKQSAIPTLSAPEERLAFHLRAEGIAFERQFHWHPNSRFRADFRISDTRILVEVQGGVFLKGNRSHTGGVGYARDRARTNAAQLLGWTMLEFTPSQIKRGEAIRCIKQALRGGPRVGDRPGT